MNKIKIATEAQTLEFLKESYGSQVRHKRIYGFYSSTFGKIITD